MKIVLLSYHSGIVFRGAETFCDALASNLTKNNEVTVFQSKTFTNKKSYKTIEINTNYKKNKTKSFLKYFGFDYYSRNILLFTLKSLPIIKKINPEIIIPVNGRWMALVIKLYTLFNKSKMLVSGQAGLGLDEKWNLFLRPDLFISLSKRNDKWVKSFFPKQKTAIIPNGVDLNKFIPSKKTNPFNLQRPIILVVAGPEKYKRVEETIKAVRELEKASLIVLGGSNDTQYLGKTLLNGRFQQLNLSHEKTPPVYNCADLFTLVSKETEAFGISYVEALACNVPVVATDDDLRHEIIGNAGFFIKNPENSKEYANVLKKALEKNWGNEPRNQSQKFDWTLIAEEYEKEFKKI